MSQMTTWSPETVVTTALTKDLPEGLPTDDFHAYCELRLALGRAKEQVGGEPIWVPSTLGFISGGSECYGDPAGLTWDEVCRSVIVEAREYLKAFWALDVPADWDGFIQDTPEEAALLAARRLGFAYWLARELLEVRREQPDATAQIVFDRMPGPSAT